MLGLCVSRVLWFSMILQCVSKCPRSSKASIKLHRWPSSVPKVCEHSSETLLQWDCMSHADPTFHISSVLRPHQRQDATWSYDPRKAKRNTIHLNITPRTPCAPHGRADGLAWPLPGWVSPHQCVCPAGSLGVGFCRQSFPLHLSACAEQPANRHVRTCAVTESLKSSAEYT